MSWTVWPLRRTSTLIDVARRVLADHQVERMRRVERRPVDRGDDVARLQAGLVGRAAGDDRVTGARRARRPGPGRSDRSPGRSGRWPWPPWALALPFGPWPAAASAVGIHAPLSTGRLFACLTVGSMVSNRMPRHGRASGWPADACASSGRAMLIGIAKPMPWLLAGAGRVDADDLAARVEQRAAAVARVDRGVGLDEVVEDGPPSTGMVRPIAEMMPLVTESVNVPSGLPMAIACWPTWMVDESPIGAVGRPRRVDLDDGEVGEGVDAVDGGVERAAVLEVDGELRGVALRRRDGW